MATTPIDILRAGMEAVCLRIGLIYRLLRPALPGDPLVVVSGGAMESSPAWVQILSDVLGRPVTLTRYDEPSARGTALLAAYSLGLITSLAADRPVGKVYEPDPGRYQVYQEAASRQQEFYQKMVADVPGAVQASPGASGG
jgi:gluconokinase